MAERGQPWHVCDDCLDPLASELFALARRWDVHFDIAKRDELDSEYERIVESGGYDTKRLTKGQQKRIAELSQQIKAQTEPPRPFDVDALYKRFNIDAATDWLKFNISVDFANDFQRTLSAIQQRFCALDFKACQIINGDLGKESTVQIRYAIRRLIDRHYELLHEAFPDRESHPERDELPDNLRAFEVEILDEYTIIGQEFRKTAEYLRRTSDLVRSKVTKPMPTVGLIERLLAGPDHAELTPTELALLDAHLQQPISMAAIQQEKKATGGSETNAKRNKLKLIRDYNRNLQSASNSPTPAKAESPGDDQSTATGFLGGAALAEALGIHADRRQAFFRQLERQRMDLGDDCWHEVREPRPNNPTFLYRADSEKLRELATAYQNPKTA